MDFGPHDPGIYREEDPPEVTHFALGCMRAVRPRETSVLHRENSCPLCILRMDFLVKIGIAGANDAKFGFDLKKPECYDIVVLSRNKR